MLRSSLICLAIGAAYAAVSSAEIPNEQKLDHAEVRREALSKLNPLIGQWRGVGRPQRYRTEGTWREKADWVWAFEENGPTIKYNVKDGKLLVGEVSWDVEKKHYSLQTEWADGSKRVYHGQLDGKKLVLTNESEREELSHRIQITMLNPKRTLVLFQKQVAGRKSFARVNEVGYTREGTRLAKDSLDGPECVVTGGLGTIKVSHNGEKYFVCCTGCRDAFSDDPEGTLKDYRDRVAKRKAEEKKRVEDEKRLISSE